MIPTKKIYLIRHGQTDFNLKGFVQGSGVDSDLNETGRWQAQQFFNAYKHIPFKKIYTSKLKRTTQSVKPFLDMGLPHEDYAGLNEINWGNKDGVSIPFKDNTYYWDMVKKWRDGFVDFKPEGGESPLDLQKKQEEVMKIILSREEEDTILICMHGRAIRILLATIMHQDLTKMDTFKHENLSLYVLNYNGQTFTIERSNDCAHLL